MSNEGSADEKKVDANNEGTSTFQEQLSAYDKEIDSVYEHELKEPGTKDEESTSIGWKDMRYVPTDDEKITRIAQLMAKYKEYNQRLATNSMEGSPTSDEAIGTDALYKRELIKQVILKGKVNTWALSRSLQKVKGPSFDQSSYLNACGVVGSYIRDGGASVMRGTGLRNPINAGGK
jgi:hypothetical protein